MASASRSRAQRKKHTRHWSSPVVDNAAPSTLQRALEVSKPEDEDEQEADAVASEVMRKEETASNGSDGSKTGDKGASNGEHASNSGVWPSLPQPVTVRREATTQEAEELQREPEEDEEKDAEDETLQRAVDGAAGSDDDDKQAPLRGLGGGCTSCSVQRKEENAAKDEDETPDTAQAALVVGRTDDPQEREADEVAERVMRMEDSDITEPSQSDDTIRRAPTSDTLQCTQTSEDDEDNATAPLRGLGGGCSSCGVQREEEDEDEEREATAHQKTATLRYAPVVLAHLSSFRNPEPTERSRYKPVVLGGQKIPTPISNQIAELRQNGGAPLPRMVRRDFEKRFGQDFSQVRVHDGEGPATIAQQLRAKAFTLGKDVVFGRGHYRPDTETGKRLLAHELTHVVQQRGKALDLGRSPTQEKLGRARLDDPLERKADAVADQAKAGTGSGAAFDGTRGLGREHARGAGETGVGSAGPQPDAERSTAAVIAPSSLASTSGSPLPTSVRRRVEPILRQNLEHVRVHSDPKANRAAAEIRAKAFTYRNHIFLGVTQEASDISLIAHEATHVVQQGLGHAQDVLQREPEEQLRVGQKCVVRTPQGGNLLLRLQPVHDTILNGDRGQPNTVGNIKSGTVAVIKEVRQYDWFVVEAETIEYGKRTGFVHKKYLFNYVPEALPTPTFAAPSTQFNSGPSEAEQDQPARTKAKADAQAIHGALGFLNDYDTLTRVLSQSPALVKLIVQIYDAETSLTGKGLWADFQKYLSSSRLEFYAALLKRAGISNESIATSYARNAQRGTNSHWITARPNVRTAVPGTKITYSVEMGPELYATGSFYTYQWMVINDPMTGKKGGAPAVVMGPATASWDAIWDFAGTHLVVCRVQFYSKQGGSWSGHEAQTPEYIEYQQTVSTEKDVVSHELDKTQPREDPGDQLRVLQAYRDALLTAEKQQGSGKLDPKTKEALDRQVTKMEERLVSSKGMKRYPIRAVHVAAETATVSKLNVFVARTATTEGRETWTLVDITNPTDRRLTGEYTGSGTDAREAIKNAIDSWDSNNRYPKGLLRVKIPAETGANLDAELKTDGASFWDSIADFFNQVGFWAGLAALGSAVALSVAPDPTISKVAAVALWTSILAGTAGASISMIQRHAEGMSTPTEDAFDTLTIVGNILGARWALGATVKGLALQGTRMGTAVVIGRFGTDIAQGILLSVEFAKQYELILAEQDPKRRTDQLVALLGKAALSGGLLILSMKGNKADLEAVGAKNVDLRRLGNPKETIDVTPPKEVETSRGSTPSVKGNGAKTVTDANEAVRSGAGVEAPTPRTTELVAETESPIGNASIRGNPASGAPTIDAPNTPPAMVRLAQEAHPIYARELEPARRQIETIFAGLGRVEARAKDPVSAANRLQRAVEKFGAKVTNVPEAIENLWDAIGTRLVLADPSAKGVDEVVSRLARAIETGELKVVEINNLSGAGGKPYFSAQNFEKLKLAGSGVGQRINTNSAKAMNSGYTVATVYIEHANHVRGELQIIGPRVQEVANLEHIPYDIALGKPLVRNVPPDVGRELSEKLAPIERAMEKLSPANKLAYDNYLNQSYIHARNLELGLPSTPPRFPVELDQVLNMKNIEAIQNEVIRIRNRFGSK
jgi:hypothetical protein